MNILMVITRGDDLGGAQMHVTSLSTGLRAAGHQVRIITGIAGPWSTMMTDAGFTVDVVDGMLREISPVRDMRAVRELSRHFRAYAPDLVCAHSSKAGMLARVAAKLANIPCVFTAHGWSFTDGIPQPTRSIFKVMEIATAPLASRIICVSEYDRQLGIRAGMNPDRLVAIHNGVPDVDASLRANPRAGQPVRATMVARFADQKDQDLLINAARDIPNLELEFIGEGPKLPASKALARSLGMEGRVRFLGAQRNVEQFLARTNIFVLASNFEGFPLSTLEGMRAGLPVIVSNVGGAGEAIVDGESGFLVPRGDAITLRDRLTLLTEKPDRRELMGDLARRRFESEFSADTMVRKTLDLYDDARFGNRRTRSTPVPRTAVIRTTPERVP